MDDRVDQFVRRPRSMRASGERRKHQGWCDILEARVDFGDRSLRAGEGRSIEVKARKLWAPRLPTRPAKAESVPGSTASIIATARHIPPASAAPGHGSVPIERRLGGTRERNREREYRAYRGDGDARAGLVGS